MLRWRQAGGRCTPEVKPEEKSGIFWLTSNCFNHFHRLTATAHKATVSNAL